jgi:ribosomal protein L9
MTHSYRDAFLNTTESTAQRVLLPRKLASYVPLDSRGSPIWPASFLKRAEQHKAKLAEAGGVTITAESLALAEQEQIRREREAALDEEEKQLKSLNGQPLLFTRLPTAETDTDAFFGSIGASDIVTALAEKKIFIAEGNIVGERVKTFGRHGFTVRLGEERTVDVDILVEKGQPGEATEPAQPA